MGNQQGSRPSLDTGPAIFNDPLADRLSNNANQANKNYYANVPLSFHPVHGTCIQLSEDMMVATRYQSFCNGLCFSNRPVAMGERIHIRCLHSSSAWSGSIRLGFTTWDPSQFDSSLLPRYSCPDLANHAGFWVKALPEGAMTMQNQELIFYYNKVGTVFYGPNAENMTPLICGLETTRPLWAIVDVYGNTSSVSIRSSMRVKKRSPPARESGLPPEVMRLASVDGHSSQSSQPLNVLAPRPSLDITSTAHNSNANSFAGLPPARSQSMSGGNSASRRNVTITSRSPTLPPLNHMASLPIVRNVTFSPHLAGRNVSLSTDHSIAMRAPGEFCNAYTFTSRPIPLGTKVAIQIISVTAEYRGGLTFGITAAELTSLDRDTLPSNSDDLLDRSEYWVVNKDVVANPRNGDELIFSFVPPGAIQIARNNQPPSTLMYVDGSLSLTFFFDLYGSVESIRMLGTIDASHPTVVSLPPEIASPQRRPSQNPDSATNIAAALAATHVSPPRESHAASVTATTSASSRAQADRLLHEPIANTPQLPPPLVPVPAATPIRPMSPISPPPLQPPPVPARPERVSLSQTTTTTTNPSAFKPQPTQNNNNNGNLKPLSLPPPTKLLTSPKSETNTNSSGFQSLTPSTASTPTSATSAVPSSAIIDAFRQNAQNALGEKADAANEDALLANECTVCLARQVDCVLYSCGHLCLCYTCAQSVRKADNLCPICRDPIKDVIKVFKC